MKISDFPKQKPIYYGWFVVLSGFIMQMITGINHQGIPTYLPILEREFGWSKTLLAAPRSIGQIESAILSPLTGYLADKFGPRIVTSIGVTIFGLGVIMFAYVNSVWSFVTVFVVMAIGASFSSLLVVSTAINSWLGRKRTQGIGLATTGLAVSGMIAVPLIIASQDAFGWRATAVGSGIAVLVVGIPASLLMRSPPDEIDADYKEIPLPHQNRSHQEGNKVPFDNFSVDFTVREALSTSTFWLLSLGGGLGMFAMSAITIHQFFQMEQGIGLTRLSIAGVIAVMNILNIVGRLIGAFLGDTLPKRILLSVALSGIGIAIFILGISQGLLGSLIYGAIYGACWGIRTPVSNSIMGEYFGRRHYGFISGCSQGISSPFAITGPVIVGMFVDIQGEYHFILYLLGSVSLIAGALVYFAVFPSIPARSNSDFD